MKKIFLFKTIGGFVFLIVLILFLRTVLNLLHTSTPDFSVYYNAAHNMLMGKSVYVGSTLFTLFAYPLVSSVIFIPFTFLPFLIAQNIFLLFNILSLIGISLLIPLLILKQKSLLFSALVFALSYLSFPTKFTLGMGQVNLIAYLFLLISILFFQKNKKILCGILFAIACLCKPILGIMILFFLFHKQWKIIFTIFIILISVFILTFILDNHALQDYMYYLFHVLPEISKPVGKEIYYNQSFMSFIFRLTPSNYWRILLSYLGIFTIIALGSFSFFRKRENILYQLSILLTIIPIIDTLSWQHHFIFLIFPFSYISYIVFKKRMLALMILLLIAYVLVSFNFKNPNEFMHFPFILLLSNTFYGAILLLGVLVFNKNLFEKQNPKKVV